MISGIEFENCGPFRGLHTIKLEEGAYAIVAQHESDPKKSNGVGKSFILEMINFAVTGRFSKSRDYNADGWITHDEKSARVKITFGDGAWVERSKKRGQSTQVRFALEGGNVAAQDSAHDAVIKYIAMDADDFVNASYFEQRKMARLVDPDQTNPGARLDIVSGWFGLGLAERAEDRASEIAAEYERALTKLVTRRDAIGPDEAPAKEVAPLVERFKVLAEEKMKIESERKDAARIEQHRIVVDGQSKRIQDVARMRKVLADFDDVELQAIAAEEEIAGLQGVRANQVASVKQKKNVSLGMFDGACPVAQIVCPAKDRINADRTAASAALASARTALEESEAAIEEAKEKHSPLLARRRALETMKGELEDVQKHVRENADEVKLSKQYLASVSASDARPLDYEKGITKQYDDCVDAMNEIRIEIAVVKAQNEGRDKRAKEVAAIDIEIGKARKLVSRYLKARAIFRLAQRRVAERNLQFVEDEANYQLADAGIELRVTARWAREANGPAKTCDECGHAFPSTAKVKTCERCGAERGQHTVQRLDFMLSDRSGALNDLGGIALQLAAGSWLLSSRQSPFATAMLDEPFAACDAHNRRQLAVQLVKMITRGTFRQAIVISHSPDTVDTYAHKIIVTMARDGARAITVT